MNLFLCNCHTSSVHYSPICLSPPALLPAPGCVCRESAGTESSWDLRPAIILESPIRMMAGPSSGEQCQDRVVGRPVRGPEEGG